MQPNAFALDDLEKKTTAQLIKIIQDFDTNYQEFKKEPRRIASLHPTVKPLKLIEYHMINSSQVNDIVYDGFSGSGSTLMAAEISGRCARCVELEPKFVDVTIRRWQELTGLQAVRASDGVLWDDLVMPVNKSQDQTVHNNMTELFDLPTGT
jgi:DNA modification methylase